jgi:hypothetical protein
MNIFKFNQVVHFTTNNVATEKKNLSYFNLVSFIVTFLGAAFEFAGLTAGKARTGTKRPRARANILDITWEEQRADDLGQRS